MKIIADTHFYYYMGQDKSLFEIVKNEPLAPTFLNILELSKTENLIDKEEYVREAVRKIFHFKNQVIYEPPFIYIANLFACYQYDPLKEFGDFLKFTEEFAKGVPLNKDKSDLFREWAGSIKLGFEQATEFANRTTETIRPRIGDKKAHRKKDTLQITARFINQLVEGNTNNQCNLEGFDLNNIELLIKTLDWFFKELELSKMKMQPNDWFDIALLAYVQPGDKIWTNENRWIRMIRECGCGEYLFEPN